MHSHTKNYFSYDITEIHKFNNSAFIIGLLLWNAEIFIMIMNCFHNKYLGIIQKKKKYILHLTKY